LYGCERVFWNDIGNMAPKGAYDEAKDKLALEGEAALSADILPSTCWAAFPEDAHMACRDMGERRDFLKAVIKLEIPKGKEA
ncbi:MAG: YhcH/YjgK/YiaL family protein, partial [Succinivibrio sp.]